MFYKMKMTWCEVGEEQVTRIRVQKQPNKNELINDDKACRYHSNHSALQCILTAIAVRESPTSLI